MDILSPSAGSWSSLVFYQVYKADGVGDKKSGDTTFDAWTHLEAFLNMALRSVCFTDEAFI